MPEEASETQVASESSAEQVAQTETPQTFIDADGKFLPGWKEHYVDENLRTDEVYNAFSDIKGGLNMLGSLQNMIGKKGVIIPGEASPETEWDNYFREKGRPDTKDLYEMKIPDDLLEVYDAGLVSEARDMFFELGYNQKEVDRMWAFEEKRIRAAVESLNQKQVETDNAFAEWEAANPEKMHWANRMITENCNDEAHKTALLESLDNNVAFAELLSNVSAKFKEHKGVKEAEAPQGMSPGEALTEAKKIEQTPGFVLPDEKGQLLRDTNRPEYERLEKERDRFYRLANTQKPG